MYWSIVQTVQGVDVVRYGKQRHGPQRYRCNNTACPRRFSLRVPEPRPPSCW